MTAPGDPTTPPAEPGHRRRRLVLYVAGGLAAAVALVGVVVGQSQAETEDPLGPDASGLSELSMRTIGGCRYEPDRGGMVGGFAVTTRDAGRFVLDVEAVTPEALDNADAPTSPHVVRYTVPFYGGKVTKRFEVVVPLAAAEHDAGYTKCRWHINGRQ